MCLWVILLFEMVSELSAEGLSGVPKPKEAVLGLAENLTCVLNRLPSDMSLCAAAHEFNMNASITYSKYSVFKQKHIKQCTNPLTKTCLEAPRTLAWG